MGGAEGLQVVTEVTPYGHVPNDDGAAALDCQKLPPPLLGRKKTKKNSNDNQLAGGDTWGALRDCRWSRK